MYRLTGTPTYKPNLNPWIAKHKHTHPHNSRSMLFHTITCRTCSLTSSPVLGAPVLAITRSQLCNLQVPHPDNPDMNYCRHFLLLIYRAAVRKRDLITADKKQFLLHAWRTPVLQLEPSTACRDVALPALRTKHLSAALLPILIDIQASSYAVLPLPQLLC